MIKPHTLQLFNSLTRKKEVFVPLTPENVSIYVCGVTVYDHCHIGHARVYVVFDCVRRYFEYLGYHVTYVQNFTDVDDKIIQKASKVQEPIQSLTDRMIDSFFEDMDALNIQRATQYPRATQYIGHMITLIEKMIHEGVAYVADGDVYFSVQTFPKYGQLSKKVLEDLIAGARVTVSEKKRNPLDFVLWKKSHIPQEPSWDSPWGEGRPGWHIECSAMALHCLGPQIDIHGGGEDLIFPHHENEICQTESRTHQPFATYWMHNGFVTLRNEKMSKSLDNAWQLKQGLTQFGGNVIRFFLLKTHYRSPLGFSLDGLKEAQKALEKLYQTLRIYPPQSQEPTLTEPEKNLEKAFHQALQDDFNVAQAIGVLFELSHHIHTTGSGSNLLSQWCALLGITLQSPPDTLSDDIQQLLDERQKAKEKKDYTQADHIRDILLTHHRLAIEDTKDGLRWKKL